MTDTRRLSTVQRKVVAIFLSNVGGCFRQRLPLASLEYTFVRTFNFFRAMKGKREKNLLSSRSLAHIPRMIITVLRVIMFPLYSSMLSAANRTET